MSYSYQRATSDGTMVALDISITYLDRSEITVYFNDVLTSAWIWSGVSDRRVLFPTPVPNGTVVMVKRTTDASALRHEFSRGAQFTAPNLDEDLKQALHMAQEANEGNLVGDFFTDVNLHGFRLFNVGVAVNDTDALTLGQYRSDSLGASAAREAAEAAAATAVAATSDLKSTAYDKGAAQIGRAAQQVANVAALRALLKTTPSQYANSMGYYSAGDGGASLYRLDAADTTSVDDGGATIVAADGGRWKLVSKGDVNVRQFGARLDGVSDDTAAWNNAGRFVLETGGGTVRGLWGKTSKITGSVYLCSNLTIDLEGCVLRGTGNSAGANEIVRSATYTAGVFTPNVQGQQVQGAAIRNGWLYQGKLGLRIIHMIDGCSVENLQILECYGAISAEFCLYMTFGNIIARNASAGAAYTFHDNCNALTLRQVHAVGTNPGTWAIGFSFTGKTYGTKLLNCGVEFCATGVQTEEVHGFVLDTVYFEGITNFGLNLGGSAFRKVGVQLNCCVFNSTPVLVFGRTVNDFVWEASNDRAADCVPGTIDLQTDTSVPDSALSLCTGVIRLNRYDLAKKLPNAAASARPTWLSLSDGMRLDATINALASVSGLTTPMFALSRLDAMTPRSAQGFAGTRMNAADNGRPFITAACPTGASVALTYDSAIDWCDYSFLLFRTDFVDGGGPFSISGFFFGTTFMPAAAIPGGKTVALSNVGGKVRVTIGGVNNTSGTLLTSGTCTAYLAHIG